MKERILFLFHSQALLTKDVEDFIHWVYRTFLLYKINYTFQMNISNKTIFSGSRSNSGLSGTKAWIYSLLTLTTLFYAL